MKLEEMVCPSCGGKEFRKNGMCQYCGAEFVKVDNPTFHLEHAKNAIENYNFVEGYNSLVNYLKKNPDDSNAHYMSLLVENNVIFLENNKGEFVPNFLGDLNQKVNISDSKHYKYLSENQKEIIADLQKEYDLCSKNFNDIKNKTKYDIFICYKKSNDSGEREAANAIYNDLCAYIADKDLKFKVFLDDKSIKGGDDWEATIYSALKTSKVLLLICFTNDNFNSNFVKSEWKRFLYFHKDDDCYLQVLTKENLNINLLDKELSSRQFYFYDKDRNSWFSKFIENAIITFEKTKTISFKKVKSHEKAKKVETQKNVKVFDFNHAFVEQKVEFGLDEKLRNLSSDLKYNPSVKEQKRRKEAISSINALYNSNPKYYKIIELKIVADCDLEKFDDFKDYKNFELINDYNMLLDLVKYSPSEKEAKYYLSIISDYIYNDFSFYEDVDKVLDCFLPVDSDKERIELEGTEFYQNKIPLKLINKVTTDNIDVDLFDVAMKHLFNPTAELLYKCYKEFAYKCLNESDYSSANKYGKLAMEYVDKDYQLSDLIFSSYFCMKTVDEVFNYKASIQNYNFISELEENISITLDEEELLKKIDDYVDLSINGLLPKIMDSESILMDRFDMIIQEYGYLGEKNRNVVIQRMDLAYKRAGNQCLNDGKFISAKKFYENINNKDAEVFLNLMLIDYKCKNKDELITLEDYSNPISDNNNYITACSLAKTADKNLYQYINELRDQRVEKEDLLFEQDNNLKYNKKNNRIHNTILFVLFIFFALSITYSILLFGDYEIKNLYVLTSLSFFSSFTALNLIVLSVSIIFIILIIIISNRNHRGVLKNKKYSLLNKKITIITSGIIMIGIISLLIYGSIISKDYYVQEDYIMHFETSSDEAILVDYYDNGTEKTVTIPDEFKGLKVKTITKNSFKKNNIIELNISNNVEAIEKGAFVNLTKLEKLSIPFLGGKIYEKDELNSNNSILGYYFVNDNNLVKSTLEENIVYNVPSNLKEVTINSGVVSSYAFKNFNLRTLTLNENVSFIDNNAFADTNGNVYIKNLNIELAENSFAQSNATISLFDFYIDYLNLKNKFPNIKFEDYSNVNEYIKQSVSNKMIINKDNVSKINSILNDKNVIKNNDYNILKSSNDFEKNILDTTHIESTDDLISKIPNNIIPFVADYNNYLETFNLVKIISSNEYDVSEAYEKYNELSSVFKEKIDRTVFEEFDSIKEDLTNSLNVSINHDNYDNVSKINDLIVVVNQKGFANAFKNLIEKANSYIYAAEVEETIYNMPTNEIPDYSNYDELIKDIDSNLIEDLVYVDYYNKLKSIVNVLNTESIVGFEHMTYFNELKNIEKFNLLISLYDFDIFNKKIETIDFLVNNSTMTKNLLYSNVILNNYNISLNTFDISHDYKLLIPNLENISMQLTDGKNYVIGSLNYKIRLLGTFSGVNIELNDANIQIDELYLTSSRIRTSGVCEIEVKNNNKILSSTNAIYSKGNLKIVGDGKIELGGSNRSSAINSEILSIENVELIAKGSNGSNGTSSGASGYDGTSAISAQELIVSNAKLTLTGGSGGNGKAGSNGTNGSVNNGSTFLYHSYGIFGAEIQSIYQYNQASSGTNGESGGAGGNGAAPIDCSNITVSSSSLILNYGNGGNGANGGAGGNGGNGHDYYGTAGGISYLTCYDPGKGGNGGNGGRGGNAGHASTVTYDIPIDTNTVVINNGNNGSAGYGGAAGKGGTGGKGGETHATANDHVAPKADNGTDGSNGSNGSK